MKALEMAERMDQYGYFQEATELRRLAEVNAELLEALERANGLLDRYRLETPMGNQPHMITLEAYECSNAIKKLSAKAKEQQ